MRQEGVRMASGRHQDNLASSWRQDDVKRRGTRINSSSSVFCSRWKLLRTSSRTSLGSLVTVPFCRRTDLMTGWI